MSDTPVVTRFAPSPTGFLHIGGARTALFNWLYARTNSGTFLLRRSCATQDEIEAFREAAREAGTSTLYRSPWRDADPATYPDAPCVVRLKAPQDGETRIKDKVQGQVTWKNDTLDDLVLLRSDGTPTYMLAVVVDDHDMGVTHVIRGDDHLTNAARQTLIYLANGWKVPVFAHIPLIHFQALASPRLDSISRSSKTCRVSTSKQWMPKIF